MTEERDETLAEAARLWAIRVGDPAFADWDAFIAWLEADPAHNIAYEAALDDRMAADALFEVAPVSARQPVAAAPVTRPARWRMAASVAVLAAAGGWFALDRAPATQHYVTAPGERREIALDDGSRIILNGGTSLAIARDRPREVAMADGEALFDVRHSDSDPFVVTTRDGTRLVDIGTVFNVGVKGGAIDVGVSEGAVIYRGGTGAAGGEVRLDAGEMLTRANAGAAPVKRRVDQDAVGGWRTGYLQYAEVPLSRIAIDLTRSLGVALDVDAALGARRFSGTLMVDGAADTVMPRIAPVLGVRIDRRGKGWAMTPSDAARP